MSEQELNLIQLTACEVAETCTGSPQVVRGKFLNTCAAGCIFDNFPENLRRHTVSPDFASLVIERNMRPSVICADAVQASTALLTHSGMGNVRIWPPFPIKSAMT